MDINSMRQFFPMEHLADTILLKTEAGSAEKVREQLLGAGRVTGLAEPGRIVESYRSMMGSMMAMMNLFSLMAVLTGVILIYNISLISIRERRVEFDTLLILGSSGQEIGWMVWFEQAKAAYEQAKAEKEKAENRLSESRSRLNSLEQQGLTKTDLNERFYESTLDQLRALWQSEQTAVNQLADQIADCEITADRDGIISSFAGKELSAVQAGQEVAVISGTSELVEAEAQVLTTIAPYIRVGDPVTVTQKLRGQELSYSGKITEVYGFANQTTSALGLKEYRVTVKAVLETGDTEALKDGYGIDMNFTLYQGENCLVIPAGAVFHFQDQEYVYAVEGGRAVKRPVTLEYQSGTQAVVKEGIEKGTVLIENVDEKELYDGVRVREK